MSRRDCPGEQVVQTLQVRVAAGGIGAVRRRLPGSWKLFGTTGAVGPGTGVRGSRRYGGSTGFRRRSKRFSDPPSKTVQITPISQRNAARIVLVVVVGAFHPVQGAFCVARGSLVAVMSSSFYECNATTLCQCWRGHHNQHSRGFA